MAIKVAINGFGRIGRQVLQAGIKDKQIKFVAINDLAPAEQLAYLLKYDSVYGKYEGKVSSTKNSITINNQKIKFFSEKDPKNLPWKELGVDIVIECTGIFTERSKAKLHLNAGAKKVLISAPAKNPDMTIVKGVNDSKYKKTYKIISNASCTTNALAPLCKVLEDKLGIKKGYMVTVHAYTATQLIVDGIHKKDYRRGRAGAVNIVPTSTGAAKALGEVIPKLKGKMDGFAWRVPVPCGSIVNVVAEVSKKTDVNHLNKLFEDASKKELKGILEYSKDPIVSTDILKNNHSAIFDSNMTKVIGNLVNISAFYDNEWGYSNRIIDILKKLK